jgi:hypothetical protein
MITVQEVKALLRSGGYIADGGIATAVFLALRMEKPILIEGPPGVGKTCLAKTLSTVLDFPLVRLQCYDGIDEGKALYDWEYGKQLLYTQLLRTQLDSYLSVSADLREAVERLSAEESLFFPSTFSCSGRSCAVSCRKRGHCSLSTRSIDPAMNSRRCSWSA